MLIIISWILEVHLLILKEEQNEWPNDSVRYIHSEEDRQNLLFGFYITSFIKDGPFTSSRFITILPYQSTTWTNVSIYNFFLIHNFGWEYNTKSVASIFKLSITSWNCRPNHLLVLDPICSSINCLKNCKHFLTENVLRLIWTVSKCYMVIIVIIVVKKVNFKLLWLHK